MKKKLLLIFAIAISLSFVSDEEKALIERQGKITFFSYTPVENIQATNNQAYSLFNPESKLIAVRILMRAFTFKKSLMYEHFNESYIESDLYPNALLEGKVIDFDASLETQTRMIQGEFTLRGITKPIEIKANITKENDGYRFQGELEVRIDDHEIKVPRVLSANIAKKIQVSFNFQYEPNEK
jgi:hypothetical protein